MSWVLTAACFWVFTIALAWDHISRAGERLGWEMYGRGMRLLRLREQAQQRYQQLMAMRPHDRELLAWHGGHTWRYTKPGSRYHGDDPPPEVR